MCVRTGCAISPSHIEFTKIVVNPYIVCFSFLRYTKPKGQLPDYTRPVVLQTGRSSVEELCNQLHKSIIKEFKQ